VSSIAGGGNSPGVAGKSDPESIVSSKKKTSPGVTPPPAASPLVARQTAGESGPPVTPKPFHFVAPVRSVQFSNTAPATNNVPLEQPPSIPMETTVSGLIVTTLRVPPPPPPSNLKQTKVELQPLAQAEAAPVLAQPQRATSYVGPKVIRPASPAIPFGFPYRITPDLELEVGVTIDENGKVTDAKLVSAKGAAARFMSASVLQAARLYLFEPAQDNNRKVASKLMLTFRFSTGPPK
jgi:hypothetical protein